jgi:hypothetical protein
MVRRGWGFEPGVVVHIYNPSTQEAGAVDHEFMARLGYKVRSFLKRERERERERMKEKVDLTVLLKAWVQE